MNTPRISLLDQTREPERVVACAARTCYTAEPLATIGDGLTDATAAKLIRKIIGMGHLSVLEHASFTFGIEGVSRVTSHQLVRHRVASWSQRSQRYVRHAEAGEIVVPPTVAADPALETAFTRASRAAFAAYRSLLAAGVPAEDARYLLPNGTTTSLVMTMNARELRHFMALRTCNRAQWEIRDVAIAILRLCREAAPALFADAGPGCLTGPCPEGAMTCGKRAAVRRFFAGLVPKEKES
jgi:thymidylate synthase (FAD)